MDVAPALCRRYRASPPPPRARILRPPLDRFAVAFLLLLLLRSSDGHELCLDYTFPSDSFSANLEHCEAWKGERVCSDDASVGRQLAQLKLTSGRCRDSYVLPLLCSSIDGWSAHLYDGERSESSSRSVPFLCEDFARGLYEACKATFMVGNPFLLDSGGVVVDGIIESNFPTADSFLSSFAANSDGYCFSGKPYVPEPSGEVIEAPSSLCVERLSDLDLTMPWPKVNRDEVWINVEPIPGLSPGVLALGSHGGYVSVYRVNGFGEKMTNLGTLIDATSFVSQPNGKGNERGLLGIAFHKRFQSNGRLFLSYTCGLKQEKRCGKSGDTAVEEFFVPGLRSDGTNLIVDASRPPKVIFRCSQDSGNHNGGSILFRPDDADPHLYILLGDGGGSGDKRNRSQDATSLLGKVLRIDVDSTPSPDETYVIPPNNPFVDVPNVRNEIYALGLRNPWRASFDADNPSYFYVADVGQGSVEEIDLLAKGSNYGWPTYEGTRRFSDRPLAEAVDDAVPPIAEYTHSFNGAGGRASVTGGYVVRTNVDPSLTGKYLFADLYDRIYAIAELPPVGSGKFTKPERVRPLCSRTSPFPCASSPNSQNFIMTFGQDQSHNVYFVSEKGLHRIVPPCLCDEDEDNACDGVDMNVDQSSVTYGRKDDATNERDDNVLRRKKKKKRTPRAKLPVRRRRRREPS